MELLAGDGNTTEVAAEVFPAHVSPLLSEPSQLVFANPTEGAMSPQKLRIRCNGRSALPEDADLPHKGVSPHKDVDVHFKLLDGSLVSWQGKRKRSSVCVSSRRKIRRIDRVEHFLENLVNKMMEKQEKMHMKLIKMVQVKEKERIAKEEAWKKQQLERIKRDEEVRAQDTARSLAIINFVQKFLGSDFQFHPPPVVGEPLNAVPPSNHEHQRAEQNESLHKDTGDVKFSTTLTDNRWLLDELRALIGLWTSVEHKYRTASNSARGAMWNEITVGMNNMGYDRTAKKCKEKWENINKYFKRAITSDRKRPASDKTCQYFNELELLYKRGLLNMGNASFSSPSNLGNGDFSPTSNTGNGGCSPASNTGNGSLSLSDDQKSENESQQCMMPNDDSLLTCAPILYQMKAQIEQE